MIRPTTILVVNDDDLGRRITCEVLRSEFAVREATTGGEAMRLSREAPDLIVLDVKLPDISGFEVCRQIKAQPETARTPVLHLSAVHLDWRSKVAGLEGGADAYLTEPIEPPVLLAVIRALLRARRAEHEVAEAARHWQATFDALADGVALLDREGAVVRCNDALPRMLSASPTALAGARWDELFGHADCRGVWQQAHLSGKRETAEAAVGGRHISCTAHPLTDEKGCVTGALAIAVDITEKRGIEERLQNAQKLEAVGRLSGGIAHDLNNVLTVVQSNAQAVHDSCPRDDPRRTEASEILRAADRGARLIQQLLLFSQRQRVASAIVNFNDVILGLDPMLRRIVGEHIELVTLAGASLWPVRADVHHLEMVVMNLVANACDAMPKGGKLTVSTTNATLDVALGDAASGEHVRLTVQDDGIGMSEEVKAHMFEPFFTTKDVRDEQPGGGAGLGLAVVHGIVTRAGGHAAVRSEPWRGTVVEIHLPRAHGETSPSAPAADASPRGSETVLLVEDDAAVRRVVGRTLRAQGYAVLEATHGEHALRVAEQHAEVIHLLLTDVVMPYLSGRELSEKLALVRPATKVLYMSGYTAGEFDAAAPDEQRQVAFLQKPFTPVALLRKVREVLDS